MNIKYVYRVIYVENIFHVLSLFLVFYFINRKTIKNQKGHTVET